MEIDRTGQVITFFSYKGGTGRTMALANAAWILASHGKRVLMVDWDLEAPGLQRFFHPFFADPDLLNATDGVVDILMDYARAATQQTDRDEDWHRDYAQVMTRAVSLDWDFPGGGTLDIIPAGRPGRGYANALAGFQWDNFYHRLGGSQLFSAMREDMQRNYDYTLIDSRTGLSDIAGICTIRFPDTVVDCFTLSTLSIEGAAAVAKSIDEQQDRAIRILPVPMRVEDGEQSKLENGRALARSAFSGFPRGLSKDQQQRYWGEVEIPYKPYYAYEETLATFGDEPRLANSLLSAYERLTAVLTNDEVREFPSLPEATRQRYAQAFERRRAARVPDVFLSYTPEDRVWADWIGQVLEQAGVHVISQGTGHSAGSDVSTEVREAVSSAGKTIVLLSNAYVRSPRAHAVWDTLASNEAARINRTLIPIRVSDVRLSPPFDVWSTVDLAGTDERIAAETVLRALELPVSEDGSGADPVSGARFPGTPPPVWNVPTRNASFTGRAALLEQLRDSLSRGMAVVMPQALHGLGGVGKTQLALEFAHRFRSDYDLVWWIAAEQEEFIQSAMAEIAPTIGIRRSENTEEAAEAVREALRLGRPYKRWLIVFDNAEDPADLEPHLPEGGHVIITSRNPAWSTVARPLEVDAFSRSESVEHLTSRVTGLSGQAAEQVARLLGDLPLAIELASAWLGTTGMPVDEYLLLLENQLTQWLDENHPVDYALSAAATWRVSIERLGQEWPAAIRLLELCSCFSPEPISMRLLYGDATIQLLLPYDPKLGERMRLARIIREIGRYALAKVDQGRSSIQVHRLVQAVIRDSMTEEQHSATEHEVHRILVSGRPPTGNTDNPDNWDSYREIWPHLGPSNATECVEEPVRELLVERVRYLWLRGEYDEALIAARRLETFWLQDRGPDDRQLLYLQFHIANVLRSQGDFAGALQIDRDVLARQRASNGEEDVHTLMTSGSLACDLGTTGDFTGSLQLARDTYDRFRDLFGEDYPYTLFAATNLSDALRLNGDCFGARELDTETLSFRQSVLGEHHPLTLNSAANLARDMREAGNFRESAALLRTALEQHQQALFPEHPETLRTASSLAVSLRKMGAHDEAQELSSSTLDQYHQLYRHDYPDALACAINLACDLSAVGRTDEALALADETLAAYLRSRGPGHQYTLVCANNRAIYLRTVGRPEESLEVARSTFEGMRRLFGPAHPYSLACAINLANALADSGALGETEELERITWDGLTRVLRADHPDTLFSQANLAITLRAQNRVDEAQATMARAVTGLERTLGADHPHIEWARRWRRISRDLEPQPV